MTKFDSKTLSQATALMSLQLNFLKAQTDLGVMAALKKGSQKQTFHLVEGLVTEHQRLSTEVVGTLSAVLSKTSTSLERQGSDIHALLSAASVTHVMQVWQDTNSIFFPVSFFVKRK